MSTTTPKGYKKPETGDKGSSFFPDLQHNISRIDGHGHDGIDSEKIVTSDLQKISQIIASANWGPDAENNSQWIQNITMPAGFLFDTTVIDFRINSGAETGAKIHPTILRLTGTSYIITINDNSIDIKATYV